MEGNKQQSIPEDIREKIKQLSDTYRDTIMLKQGYHLRNSEVEKKDMEISLLKNTLLKTDYRSELETKIKQQAATIAELLEGLEMCREQLRIRRDNGEVWTLSDEDTYQKANYLLTQ